MENNTHRRHWTLFLSKIIGFFRGKSKFDFGFVYNTKVNTKLEFVYCFARGTKAMAFSDFGLQSKSEYFPGTVLHKSTIFTSPGKIRLFSMEIGSNVSCDKNKIRFILFA